MKKLYILLASIMAFGSFSTPAMAQEEEAPNRLLLIDNNQYYKGYAIDFIEGIQFANVEGQVLAPVEILDIPDLTSIEFALQMTDACKYYRLAMMPKSQAERWDDLTFIRYAESNGSEPMDEAFGAAILSGINLKSGTEYYLVSVAYDELDTPVGVSKALFATESVPIVGEPYVDVEILSLTRDSFTVQFTPNKDVLGYYYMVFEEGTWEEYLAMWGPSFGCTNISELIAFWYQYDYITEPRISTFGPEYDIFPGESYDLIVAVMDANGNFTPAEIIPISTQTQGGPGEAYVDIEINDYTAEIWNGEMLPSLYLEYIPNDQTSRYRQIVHWDYSWERYGELLVEELMQDPPQAGIVDWWTYESEILEYQIMPETTVYAIAVAQNANHEWGEPNVYEITTPAECPGYNPSKAKIRRIFPGEEKAPAQARFSKKLIDDNIEKGVIAPRPETLKKYVITQK